jgi:hypothetical protein
VTEILQGRARERWETREQTATATAMEEKS